MTYSKRLSATQALLATVLLSAGAQAVAQTRLGQDSQDAQDACDQALIAAQARLDQASAAGDMPSPDRSRNLDALVNAAVDARHACTGEQGQGKTAMPSTHAAPAGESSSGKSMADKLFESESEPSSNAERRSRERARSPKAG